MYARVCVAFLVVCAALAQDSVWVDVEPNTEDPVDTEGQYTDELASDLKLANENALLLYTEYSAKTAAGLREFLQEMTNFTNQTLAEVAGLDYAPEPCRTALLTSLHQAETNARRAAHFSAENHHKFLLGHMIVFRMHLNKSEPCRTELLTCLHQAETSARRASHFSVKNHHMFLLGHKIVFRMHLNESEDFIKKCDKAVNNCGVACEKIPRVQRWRRHAANELHRFQEDMQHSRRSYKDLLLHSRRKLNHLRKQAAKQSEKAVEDFKYCLRK